VIRARSRTPQLTTMNQNLLTAIYWLTYLFKLGPIGSSLNDIATGILDSDQTEVAKAVLDSLNALF
jgi:hypothetical protein